MPNAMIEFDELTAKLENGYKMTFMIWGSAEFDFNNQGDLNDVNMEIMKEGGGYMSSKDFQTESEKQFFVFVLSTVEEQYKNIAWEKTGIDASTTAADFGINKHTFL